MKFRFHLWFSSDRDEEEMLEDLISTVEMMSSLPLPLTASYAAAGIASRRPQNAAFPQHTPMLYRDEKKVRKPFHPQGLLL
jgi:hypothetical protein